MKNSFFFRAGAENSRKSVKKNKKKRKMRLHFPNNVIYYVIFNMEDVSR